jgi:hypothetical protein
MGVLRDRSIMVQCKSFRFVDHSWHQCFICIDRWIDKCVIGDYLAALIKQF